MALADLDLEEGRPGETERQARQSIEEFRKAKDPDTQAGAEILLVHALLAQHKTEEARTVIADAQKLAGKGGTRSTQIDVAIGGAEVQAASGRPVEAAQSLKQVVVDCRKTGFAPLEFDARLALGEAEVKTANSGDGRAELKRLEQDARAKGFLLIARKAAIARTGKGL